MRILRGRKEVAKMLYGGYDIAFDRVGKNSYSWRNYTHGTYNNRTQAGCDYYISNTILWKSVADAKRGLEFILEGMEEYFFQDEEKKRNKRHFNYIDWGC